MHPLKHNKKIHHLVILSSAVIYFGIPISIIYANTIHYVQEGALSSYHQLIQLAKTHAKHGKIYFFSTNSKCFPLVDYAEVETASRFQCFWPLLNILHLHSLATPESQKLVKKQEKFFIQSVVEDMQRGKPTLVFIEPHIRWGININFNYIKYFSQSPEFRAIWKNYRYLTTIERIDVYERVAT